MINIPRTTEDETEKTTKENVSETIRASWTSKPLLNQAASFNRARQYRVAHYFALFSVFWSLGLRFGYLASSDAISDVIFLLGDADFL